MFLTSSLLFCTSNPFRSLHRKERFAPISLQPFPQWRIKVLIALVGWLSLSIGWENGPEQGRKPVSFIPKLPVIYANSADPDQMPHSVASDLGLHRLSMPQSRFYR